jgi:hypothetical protein
LPDDALSNVMRGADRVVRLRGEPPLDAGE